MSGVRETFDLHDGGRILRKPRRVQPLSGETSNKGTELWSRMKGCSTS